MQARFDPAVCNIYLFYASDGDNASDDRAQAEQELESIGKVARYAGYVEISAGARSSRRVRPLSCSKRLRKQDCRAAAIRSPVRRTSRLR